MLAIILFIIAAAFGGYAVITQYRSTPVGESVPKRIWLSVVAAAAALGSAVMAWVHNSTGP